MFFKKPADINPSEITPEHLYWRRREFIKGAGSLLLAAGAAAPPSLFGRQEDDLQTLDLAKKGEFTINEDVTPFSSASTTINYYEFSMRKREAKERAASMKTRPWTVEVEGEVKAAKTFDVDDLLQRFPLEERIYRHRCVEAWSMVIPWVGFPLKEFINLCEPTSEAKFVQFFTLLDRKVMPGTRIDVLGWPYREALRLDEALHPLALMSVGMYGRVLPNQNGAPIRLVIPWKYGFKSIKSIVRARFSKRIPDTSWNQANAKEYGFYGNVNPKVAHPRWSQAQERRIGEGGRRKTLLFNGYADQVGDLYAGLDLRRNY
jgi:sulfoxide reductase catalytic subunit YedY